MIHVDDEVKCFSDILLNDCLIANGCCAKTTHVIVQEIISKTSLFEEFLKKRKYVFLHLSSRGNYYYALKIMNDIKIYTESQSTTEKGFILNLTRNNLIKFLNIRSWLQ